jgi:thioredoxin 1
LRRFATQYSDVKFYKFDIDSLPDIAQELSVSSIPNFKIFKDGELVDNVVGAKPAAIEAAIKKATE